MVDAVTPRGGARAAAPATETYRALRAKALDGLGVFTTFLGDLDGAQRWLDESLALYRELGDDAEIAEVLADRGMVFQMQGDFARAGVDLHESLRLYRDAWAMPSSVGFGLFFLGTLAYAEGHVLQAGARWEESLTILRPRRRIRRHCHGADPSGHGGAGSGRRRARGHLPGGEHHPVPGAG